MRITAEDVRHRLAPILMAQGFGLLCGIIGVGVTSHWIAPADYGAYGVFVSFASAGVTVVYAGSIKFLNRYWLEAADRGAMLRAALGSFLRKSVWLAVAAAGLLWVTAPENPFFYGAALWISAVGFGYTQIAQTALQAAREHWLDLGVSAAVSVSRSFLPPLLYVATHAGQAALCAGFALQAVLGAALGFLTLRRWKPQAARGPAGRLASIYEGPWFVALALATWLLAGLQRWLAAWFFGVETAGYFTLAGNVGAVLPTILASVLLLFFQPRWFGTPVTTTAERRQLAREVDRTAALYTSGAVLLTLALHSLMPRLVGRLIGEQYAQAAELVLMTGCAATSVGLGGFFHVLLLAVKQESACPRVDLSGAACLVIGSIGSAAAGLGWFKLWLLLSPAVPWLVNRTLARRQLKRGETTPAGPSVANPGARA